MKRFIAALLLCLVATVADARCWKGENVSWYTDKHTASGEPYRQEESTCAHRTAKFGTRLRVTAKRSGKSVVCRVNDRGPNKWTKCDVDLNRHAAKQLGILDRGVALAKIEPIAVVASADPDAVLSETGSPLESGGIPADFAELYGAIEKLHPPTDAPFPAVKTPQRGLVALQTRSGQSYIVAAGAAKAFSGFVNWLESTGYKIKEIGGYTYRRIAGTRTISNHARGTAIDINQQERNVVSHRLPSGVTAKAAEFGLLHGAVWRHPDTGHFELIGSRRFAVIGGATRYAKAKKRHHRHTRVAYR